MVSIVLAVSAWQTRNMLATDGSEELANVNLVTMQGDVTPMLKPGQRTLIYFWAPWCSVCAISIGSLDNVNEEALTIVTVAMDFDSIGAVEQFVSDHEVSSTVLLGNEELRHMFKLQGYPSYYLVNEDAKVVAKSVGLNTSIGIRLKDWLSR